MADKETVQFDLRRDGVGLVICALGGFVLALVVMSLFSGSRTGRGASMAAAIVGAVGHLPALIAALGCAVFGARAFVGGRDEGLLRNAGGIVACSLGLSVLIGAFSPTGGGELGRAIGSAVTARMSILAGAFVGLVAVLLPAWFFWLREFAGRLEIPVRASTKSTADTENEISGVSAEETAALVPDEATLEAMREALREAGAWMSTTPLPASPYPEDVRLRGELPEGTSALKIDEAAEEADDPPAPDTEQPLAPEVAHAGDDAPGPDLADAGAGAPRAAAAAEPRPAPPAPVVNRLEPETVDPLPKPVVFPLGTERGSTGGGPPVAAWEQPDLFNEGGARGGAALEDEEENEDRPYEYATEDEEELEGEALKVEGRTRDEARGELGDTAVEEEDAEPGGDDEDEDEYEDEYEYDDDYDDDEYEDEDDEEDEDEDEDEDEEDEEDEDEEDEDEDEEYEYEYYEEEDASEVEVEAEAEGDVDAEAEAEEDEEAEEEGQPTLVQAISEPPIADEVAPPEGDAGAVDAVPEVAAPSEPATEPAEPVAGASPTERERDVVLKPAQPRPSAAEPAKVPATGSRRDLSREQLIQESGALFLERGRVAVSLLQRNFSLSFDEACEVLDELQEVGLVGPYLGGQRRDILLTAEEWQQRVASS